MLERTISIGGRIFRKHLLERGAATMIQRTPLDIEITSDSICPFCYLGYKRIQKAIAKANEENLPLDFSLRFSPFLLDPTLPPSPGEVKRERYARRFGGEAKVKAMEEAMIARGLPEGIHFSYGGRVSQTVDSHRLITKARELKGEEGQLKLIEALFKSYFEEEVDPGDHDALATDAEKAGVMTKTEALDFLKTDECLKEVEEGFLKAQYRGISGVPFTIINGKVAVSGAQESEAFFDVFKRIAEGQLKL